MNKLIIFIFSILLLGSCGNPDDLQIIDAWIYGENSSGTQYGRTPSSQVEQNYFIGAKVVNVGDDPQTNITLTTDFGTFSFINSVPSLNTDDTVVLQSLEPLSLVQGFYQLNYTVTSDLDDASEDDDNVLKRNFAITNGLYSTDGKGLHPAG